MTCFMARGRKTLRRMLRLAVWPHFIPAAA